MPSPWQKIPAAPQVSLVFHPLCFCYCRKSQTLRASPAEPGELLLEFRTLPKIETLQSPHQHFRDALPVTAQKSGL